MRIGWQALRGLRICLRCLPPDLGSALAYRLPAGWLATPIDATVHLRGHRISFRVRSLVDVVQRVVYFTGTYEPAETEFMLSRLRPGSVFVDVGANLGYHTLLAGDAVGPSGRVIAIEPVASNIAALSSNISDNGFLNTTVIHCAATAEDGVARLTGADEGGQTGWGGLDAGGSLVVKARRLDDLVEQFGVDRVDFLKIDVEGGEPDVLSGARHLLNDPLMSGPLMVELNAPRLAARGRRPDDVVELLCQAGWVDRTPPTLRSSGPVQTRVFERR